MFACNTHHGTIGTVENMVQKSAEARVGQGANLLFWHMENEKSKFGTEPSLRRKKRKGIVTPTEMNVHGDASCFAVTTWARHKPSIEQWLAVGGGWRLVVCGWWRLAVAGWRRLAVGGLWLVAVSGCRLVAAGGWRFVVGGG